jgi:hypothetical protein
MLFDLKGKRRRAIQVTYVILAGVFLIGFVAFGVGGNVSLDPGQLFGGGGNNSSGNSVVEKRLKNAQKLVQQNPKNEAALKDVTRSAYQLATADSSQQTGAFGAKGKQNLRTASAAWQKYLALNPKTVDPSLGLLMVQAYTGLGDTKNAAKAGELFAASRGTPQAYIQLTQLWALAGDKRRAGLAAKKAVALAPKAQRSSVKAQVALAKNPQALKAQQQAQGNVGGVPAPK